MTLRHTLMMSGLLLACAGFVPMLAAAADEAAPAPAGNSAPPPAPVYIIKEADAKRAVVAQTQASEDERQAVQLRVNAAVGTMRHMGIVTASAVLMLIGSAAVGVAIALLINAVKNARSRRAG